MLKNYYNIIKTILNRKPNIDTKGQYGWSPETKKGNEIALLLVYNAGYTSEIKSKKYNFNIIQGYTDKTGDTFTLKGNIQDVKDCINELTKEQ